MKILCIKKSNLLVSLFDNLILGTYFYDNLGSTDSKHISEMMSENAKIYFEIMPYKLEKLANSKVVTYQAYDVDEKLIHSHYILVNNNENFIQLKTKIYSKLEKLTEVKSTGSPSDYAIFLQNREKKLLLKKANSEDIVVNFINKDITLRFQELNEISKQ